ncbi:ribonuclease HII [Mogibacterium pumilum]|nr:ribonuclease HII [Mogibacterium pumilum]
MTKQEREEKKMKRMHELLQIEDELRESGIKNIAGIDEVGRGPLAGPVYAACVVLPSDFRVPGVDDSKKVSEKQREKLYKEICEGAVAYGIGIATAKEIDDINILNATKLAMHRAITEVQNKLPDGENIEMLLIDAVDLEAEGIAQKPIIKGDATCYSIAAASIVAKVSRDSFMKEIDTEYPGYGFASNKGYGTATHYDGLHNLGISPIHRKSFLKKFKASEESKMAKKKFYAVKVGRIPGIYGTWDECKMQVDGFPNSEYKGFARLSEAEEFVGSEVLESMKLKPNYFAQEEAEPNAPLKDDGIVKAYVDGSYDIATGHYASGAVILVDGETVKLNELYTDDAGSKLRNVAGEIKGAELAINYCKEHGIDSVVIYHDYLGVGKWADDEWKANLDMTRAYKEYIRENRKSMKISFVKVKGHSGDKYNELADALAKAVLNK